MRTIYKYKVEPFTHIEMPKDAEILCVQMQRGEPQIWAIVDDVTEETESRYIQCIGTGHNLPPWCHKDNYIGTFQIRDENLVFHVFDVSNEAGRDN